MKERRKKDWKRKKQDVTTPVVIYIYIYIWRKEERKKGGKRDKSQWSLPNIVDGLLVLSTADLLESRPWEERDAWSAIKGGDDP